MTSLTKITDYATLQNAIKSYVVDEVADDTIIQAFISLAESRLNDEIRHFKMVKVATSDVAADNQWVKVPVNYLETKTLTLIVGNQRKRLQFLTEDQIDEVYPWTTPDEPSWYSVIGTEFRLIPPPSGDYTLEIVYYAQIPPLTDQSITNWLLSYKPVVYLFGSLIEAAEYLKNPDEIMLYQEKVEVVASLNAASKKAEYSAGPLLVTTDYTAY